MWTVYALRDPRTGPLRYVGCTLRDPAERLSEHLSDAKMNAMYFCAHPSRNLRGQWLARLYVDGVRPELVVLCSGVLTIEEACAQEQAWILHLRSIGVPLLNAKRATCARGRTNGRRMTAKSCSARVDEIVSELSAA